MPTHRLLTIDDILQYAGVCRRTLEHLVQKRRFPQPFKLGRQLRWRQTDIDEWERSRSGVIDGPIQVVFDRDCPGYPAGTGAAFDVSTAAMLVGLHLSSLDDPSDLSRLSREMLPIMQARKAAESEGKEFVIRIDQGPLFSVPKVYGYEQDDDRGDDGDDTPETPEGDSGGTQLDPVNRLLAHYERDNLIAEDLAKEREQATVGPEPILNEAADADGDDGELTVDAETPYEAWAREEENAVREVLNEQARFFGVEPALNEAQQD